MPITISAGQSTIDFNVVATTQSGSNGLIPYTSSGSIPSGGTATLLVGVNPAALSAGTYFGEIQVMSTNTPDSIGIAVMLTVGANTTGVTVMPTSRTIPVSGGLQHHFIELDSDADADGLHRLQL